jgi:hypothetical protein
MNYSDAPILNLIFTKILYTPKLPSSNLDIISEGPIEKALNAQLSAIF